MTAYYDVKPCFLTELFVKELPNATWELTDELKYYSNVLGKIISVPKGFQTDFASVPRVPIAYMFFGGKVHRESVVHDFLYKSIPHICTRAQADKVFLEAMKARGKNIVLRTCMYIGVRIGGWMSWRKEGA